MTNDELLSHLRKLGTSSIEVAQSLKTQNIRGTRGKSCDCPIANYLKMIIPDARFVAISPVSLLIKFRGNGDHLDLRDIPNSISSFMVLFDDGEFPFLESR